MKSSTLFASLSVAVLGMGSAQAATLTFTVQNKILTSSITNTFTNTCTPIIPSLGTVLANSTSVTHQLDCGTSTAVAFRYASGTKTCTFNLSSIYTPPDPFLGTPASWTPSGTATSNGSTFATCKATLTGIGASGSYTWALSMQ
ncbi:hypothetical protein D7V97_08425 [Corallococcus sp. CA053C]|uniref:hypothetical protein n=1 Tax=Corallococcus sp. CA053C TaxID=2316732 RepID=UPI000EA220BD|nr:hypothetical protein [Corallococcus sp. CA053C]RKH12472.1 hypothetical protein D7V97_08425 [Corallococcus sp. CA053C]